MELSVIEVKDFPGSQFTEVIKHVHSLDSKTVRPFNTLSNIDIFKNHLRVLAEMPITLPSPSHRRFRCSSSGLGSRDLSC